MKTNIIIKDEKCTGCMSCELACSFHHRKIFKPSVASIEVGIDEKERKIFITIYNRESERHIACDNCIGEEIPLCVRFCSIGALILKDK